jgi:hypothetical protein
MDIVEGLRGAGEILLLVQQNRIYKRQNEIMLRQYEHDSGVHVETHPDRPGSNPVKHFLSIYWPSVLIVLLIAGFLGAPSILNQNVMGLASLSSAQPTPAVNINTRLHERTVNWHDFHPT